jgi:hypothetical protein
LSSICPVGTSSPLLPCKLVGCHRRSRVFAGLVGYDGHGLHFQMSVYCFSMRFFGNGDLLAVLEANRYARRYDEKQQGQAKIAPKLFHAFIGLSDMFSPSAFLRCVPA